MFRAVLAALVLLPSVALAQLGIGETVSRANLRVRPSSDAPVLLVLPARSEVNVREQSADWYRVQNGKTSGWVHRSLLKVAPATADEGRENARATDAPRITRAPESAPEAAAAPAPVAASEARATVASSKAKNDDKKGAAGGGYEGNHLYAGARTWLGVYGTLSIGGTLERPMTKPGQYGPGIISAGVGADFYRYSTDIGGIADWSVTVIPITGFANYHFPLKNKKLDPYAGIGVGYAVVSASVRTYGGDSFTSRGRASGVYLSGSLGARYYVRPTLALQAETGFGVGALSLGVSWKM